MDETLTLGGLFISAFVSATLWPGGSEILLYVLTDQNTTSVMRLWLVATAGNTLGGLSSWLIGRFTPRLFGPDKNHRLPYQRRIDNLCHWGSPALLLSWLPVIGDALCVAAGWLGIPFLSALLFIALGKAVRYAIIIMVAS